MAKNETVQYRVTQSFQDPYSGEVYPEHRILDKLPGWAKSDIQAALVSGLLVEIIVIKPTQLTEDDNA